MHLSETIAVLGEAPFMIDERRSFSYADLAGQIRRFGTLFAEKSVEPGQVVAITGPYGFLAAAAFLALAENRNVVVPLVGSDRREVEDRMREADAVWMVEAGRGSANCEFRISNGGETEGRGEGEKRSTPACTGQALNAQRSTLKLEPVETGSQGTEDGGGKGEKRSTLNTQRSTLKLKEPLRQAPGEPRTKNQEQRSALKPSSGRARDERRETKASPQETKDSIQRTKDDRRETTSTSSGRATDVTAVTREALFFGLRQAGRAGLILFSSGSTGRAKGMLHDLDTLIASYPPGKSRGLRVLAFMGLDHIGGIDIFLRGIASGACLVVPAERSPDAICRLIEEARVDVLPTTPSFLNLMLLSDAYRGRNLSSLKIIGFGAERMPPSVLGRLREVFPKVHFQQKFGTSETNAVRTVSKESDPLWMRIDDPGVEWKIVDEELWLKTPSRIIGYINHESDRLEADGWYRTGDLVEEDAEGFFRIVGRRESMINVGGEKVVPGEVEAVIGELDEVRDCRVFGEASPIMGQVVMAEIVLAEGVEGREAIRAVRKYCREKLAPYKVPVKIRVLAEIGVNERFKRKI